MAHHSAASFSGDSRNFQYFSVYERVGRCVVWHVVGAREENAAIYLAILAQRVYHSGNRYRDEIHHPVCALYFQRDRIGKT